MADSQQHNQLTFDELWVVIKAFYRDDGFANDAVASYERFIHSIDQIPIPVIDVVCDHPTSSHRNTMHIVRFAKAYVGKPIMHEDDPQKKASFLQVISASRRSRPAGTHRFCCYAL
jgi:hypothetical protein